MLYDNEVAIHLRGANPVTIQELNDIIRLIYPGYPHQNIDISLPIVENEAHYNQLVLYPIIRPLLDMCSLISNILNPGLYQDDREAAINLDPFAKIMLTAIFIFNNPIPNIAHR